MLIEVNKGDSETHSSFEPQSLSDSCANCSLQHELRLMRKELGHKNYLLEQALRKSLDLKNEVNKLTIESSRVLKFSRKYTLDDLKKENRELKFQLGLEKRERRSDAAPLKKQIENLQGELKLLRKKHFGKKSEKKSGREKGKKEKKPTSKKRGQQPGSKGHGRRKHEALPIKDDIFDLPDKDKVCKSCGECKIPVAATEDSEQVEIEIKAHKRVIRRQKYRSGCQCPETPLYTVAKGPLKLIPKGSYGTSIWVEALLDKYLYQRPTHKFIQSMKTLNVHLPHGTLIGGFKKLSPLFEPIYAEIINKSREDHHWHMDETGWKVFEEIEGKKSQQWWLWVFASKSVVAFSLDPSRAASVPKELLTDGVEGVISSDRFSAYRVLTKDGRFVSAFCWAHIRREFVDLLQWPDLSNWANEWIDAIANLYRLNDIRVKAFTAKDILALNIAQENLRKALFIFAAKFTVQLMCDAFDSKQLKLLSSIEKDWKELTTFFHYPEVSMDNNRAEREIRGPVCGRKAYYGSHAIWSGELLAMLYSIFRTLILWNINPRKWLQYYLDACSEDGAKFPANHVEFLPWNMKAQILENLSATPKSAPEKINSS